MNTQMRIRHAQTAEVLGLGFIVRTAAAYVTHPNVAVLDASRLEDPSSVYQDAVSAAQTGAMVVVVDDPIRENLAVIDGEFLWIEEVWIDEATTDNPAFGMSAEIDGRS